MFSSNDSANIYFYLALLSLFGNRYCLLRMVTFFKRTSIYICMFLCMSMCACVGMPVWTSSTSFSFCFKILLNHFLV